METFGLFLKLDLYMKVDIFPELFVLEHAMFQMKTKVWSEIVGETSIDKKKY